MLIDSTSLSSQLFGEVDVDYRRVRAGQVSLRVSEKERLHVSKELAAWR